MPAQCASCDLLKLLDSGEMLIDEHRIGQWPQVFGGLEFGGIRRQEQQMDVLRDAQTETGMPARAVQHQHNLLAWAGSGSTGKGGEHDIWMIDGKELATRMQQFRAAKER